MTKSHTPKTPTKEVPQPSPPTKTPQTTEIGGREGPEPVRYGDWEIGGKCVDF